MLKIHTELPEAVLIKLVYIPENLVLYLAQSRQELLQGFLLQLQSTSGFLVLYNKDEFGMKKVRKEDS